MSLETLLTGIAAIITAAGGITLVIRELRRRDRRSYQREIDELSEELHIIRQDFVAWRRYTFLLREQMADQGFEVPEPPAPHQLVTPEENDAILKRRLFRRKEGE